MQHVRVDQHRQHAQGLVVLDEAHAAHVGGQVVDRAGASGGGPARLQQREVATTWFSTSGVWYHSASGFTSTARILLWPPAPAAANQVTADEATGAGDDDQIILGHLTDPSCDPQGSFSTATATGVVIILRPP